MDLSGRAPAYRGANVRCPACAEMMRCEAVPSAEIDVCDTCGGVWVDWFDGEVQTIAVEAEAARLSRGESTSGAIEPGGAGACPRCARSLTPE
ncbi:MAG TPA: zf-TFIIB domain-containing protein, partial [Labilithrix sp.]|nr:zf-TFIIB domain-containing protein [Labilithrix sp.]